MTGSSNSEGSAAQAADDGVPAEQVGTPVKTQRRKGASQAKPGATKAAPPVAGITASGAARKAPLASASAKLVPVKKPAAVPTRRNAAASQTEPAQPTNKRSSKRMKEITMADYNDTMSNTMTDTVSELQDRSKAAYEKSSEMMTDMSEHAKGNVEAVVESGKIFSTGMQDLARAYVEDAKSAYEQMTADLKEMAAVKSPTELLQLQGKIMRRNFDSVVASSSKNAEKMMKLSNDAFAPISARLNLAAEKMSKVD